MKATLGLWATIACVAGTACSGVTGPEVTLDGGRSDGPGASSAADGGGDAGGIGTVDAGGTGGSCGNGVVETGEECDEGAATGTAASCCSATCGYRPAGTVCRAAAGACDVAEACTGGAAACPADGHQPDGTACAGGTCQSGTCAAVPPPSPGAFPDASTTGVPAGVTLTPYTGPCTITSANTVIDAQTIDCDLSIQAANVTISRSKINGSVATDESSTGFSFTITDSEVDAGDRVATGVGAVSFTVIRIHVRGGNRSIHCWRDCEIRDSYVHGQMTDETGVAHESGIRMGQNATIRHNTILCDAPDVPPDAGCSADLTGYGDFGPVQNNVIDDNLFKATTGGTCAYGGSSQGKPYSNDANHIQFTNNVFERGPGGKCGYWFAITDFDPSLPGNVWTGNTWDDGSTLSP